MRHELWLFDCRRLASIEGKRRADDYNEPEDTLPGIGIAEAL
jgi:hypothetical protein